MFRVGVESGSAEAEAELVTSKGVSLEGVFEYRSSLLS